ncbi:MAG: HEPN domain-containing protein [Patescibacteria group bacterium]|nr:HEPN domain-containing protein [Patescibacteria group bacterium]
MNDSLLYQDWLKHADNDEISLRAVLKEGTPNTACFLAHLISEKYLKALLLFYRAEYPKVHDLVKLAKLLESKFPDIKELGTDLEFLTEFHIEARYPADIPNYTPSDAKRAYESVLRIKEFVKGKIQANS